MKLFHFFGYFLLYIFILQIQETVQTSYDSMKCAYGERGSLTAYCFKASSDYFKRTTYRFDHLDETLICMNCSLETIAPESFDIGGNKIKTLNLSNSGIKAISAKAFVGLIFLETLILSNNRINSISPGAFAGMSKIHKLLIRDSLLSPLEGNVFLELHQLRFLDLGRNNLTELKNNTFVGLNSLEYLNLDGNRLTELGDSLKFLPNLRLLFAPNNQIEVIRGDEFTAQNQLLFLSLANNLISNFSMRMNRQNNLRYFDLSNNQLGNAAVPVGAFKELWALEQLNLGLNWFKKIPTKFFEGLYNLRSLSLHGNQIMNFESGSFSGLPNLRMLNLSHNNINSARITGKLSLHELHVLDLSNNEISEFDYVAFIQRAPRITSVNLQNNSLSCRIEKELKLYFEHDYIRFTLDNFEPSCNHSMVNVPSNNRMMQLLANEIESTAGRYSVPQTVMFLLVTLLIVCVGLLFYVHFTIIAKLASNYQN